MSEMEFTGERYVPLVQGQIKYEHLHRYALSLAFVADKRVLDIACGEGYGTALLAKRAASVTGVDIDPETVEHAKRRYGGLGNVSFGAGGCDAIPLADQSVDVVVSFETIEHHDKHEEMLREIVRVLRPDGVLLLSSPNRSAYSDAPGYANPFHVKELFHDELVGLLEKHFTFVQVYGQKIAAGSFVFPLRPAGGAGFKAYTSDNDSLAENTPGWEMPLYFLAICAHAPIDPACRVDSIYAEAEDLWQPLVEHAARLEQHAHALARRLAEAGQEGEALVRRLAEVGQEGKAREQCLKQTEQRAQTLERRLAEAEQQVGMLQPQALALAAIEQSRSWRAAQRLRRFYRAFASPLGRR